jgi:ABC-type transporter Mla subunit MlaD
LLNRPFRFHILDKKGFRKSRNISQNRTLLDVSKPQLKRQGADIQSKLDVSKPQLKRQGADIQSKVEELEQINQAMRDRDKLKDDAIANLSDQLIALTARLDSIEKQQ